MQPLQSLSRYTRTLWARLITAFVIVLTFASLLPLLHASAQETTPPGPGFARPLAGYQIVSSTTPEAVPSGVNFGWNAACPTPKVVLGGGFFAGDAFNLEPELLVVWNGPSVNFEGFYDGKFWHVEVKNVGPNPSFFTVYAVCALAAP